MKFTCHNCGQRLEAGPEAVGLQVPCPSCATELTVPPELPAADAPGNPPPTRAIHRGGAPGSAPPAPDVPVPAAPPVQPVPTAVATAATIPSRPSRRRNLLLISVSALGVLLVIGSVVGAIKARIAGASGKSKAAAKKGGAPAYDAQVKPILARYCYDCHGETKPKADLSLVAFKDAQSVAKDRATWEKVMQSVRTREMPPKNKPQPTQAERDFLAGWIAEEIYIADCSNPDPGRVTIRRLNRAEYNNTIRDLVGVNFQPADDFPADDSGYGFDNIGDVLAMPPILFEKYAAAAEKILKSAFAPASSGAPVRHFPAGKLPSTAKGGPFGDGGQAQIGRAHV